MLTIDDVTIVADGLDHCECVAWHPDGSLWAGGEGGQIYRMDASGLVTEVANTGGFILGIAFSRDRDWLAACDLKKKCVWKLDLSDFTLHELTTGVPMHRINIPNFVSFDAHGNFYLSESGAFREVSGKILKYNKAGEGEVWCEGPFNFANGIALDRDEKHLYVVCSFLPGIERISINPDGSAGRREVFVKLPQTVPDGIAFDADGNLYVACYAPSRIYKISPNGSAETLIDDWEAHTLCNPTNIAFGGEDLDQLYVANLGRWHIGRIASGVRGLQLACHR